MSDQQRVKRRVLTRLFAHASVLLPLLGGLTALTYTLATGEGMPWVPLGGALAVLASAGAVATRWLFSVGDLTKEAWEEVEARRHTDRERSLDELEEQLQIDGDPRTEVLLRRLRQAEKDLAEKGVGSAFDQASRVELSFQANGLVEKCVEALEASLSLRERSRILSGAPREAVEAQRHAEVAEVQACVETLERLAIVRAATVSETSGGLQRMRDELQQSLEVARRVEERMKTLETGIGQDSERGSYSDPSR